jgi:hypothetical protein
MWEDWVEKQLSRSLFDLKRQAVIEKKGVLLVHSGCESAFRRRVVEPF